ALRPIEESYWYKAYFSYFFFYAETEDAHCYADRTTGRPSYTDLQFNRDQVVKLWPGEPDDIAESYPNVRVADNPSIQELLTGAKLLALLSAGKLDAWARPMHGKSDFVRIPKDAWDHHYIDVQSNSGKSIDKDGAH